MSTGTEQGLATKEGIIVAQLTAQTVAKRLTYMADAKNNVQEAPGTAHVTPADGSNPGNGLTPGKNVNIFRIPQPGDGFPTGKSATHSAGTYKPLVTAILQQSNNTAAGQGTATPVGLAVVADPHTGGRLQNSLQNDISVMSAAAQTAGTGKSTPTVIAGGAAGDGLSQGAETIN